jgi:hypothetical protein
MWGEGWTQVLAEIADFAGVAKLCPGAEFESVAEDCGGSRRNSPSLGAIVPPVAQLGCHRTAKPARQDASLLRGPWREGRNMGSMPRAPARTLRPDFLIGLIFQLD